MEASLVMFKADGSRRDFPLREGSLVVGRKNSCELRIPLSSVSRQHCEITLDGDAVKLRDLGSSNGTYHNSIRVQEAELTAGDEVVVGPVVFTLVVDGVPQDIQPVRTILGGGGASSAGGSSQDSGATLPAEQPMAAEDSAVASSPVRRATESESTVDLSDDDSSDPFDVLEALSGESSIAGSTKPKPGGDESSVVEFNLDDLDIDLDDV